EKFDDASVAQSLCGIALRKHCIKPAVRRISFGVVSVVSNFTKNRLVKGGFFCYNRKCGKLTRDAHAGKFAGI
ncbi:MAG: hypothetical protein ACLUGC_07705, partial [Ruminococcus callidus]|uniref:hypothetical protein n=1 Tax=Ruminococcus callidus TaxID=40519 RepID=UPI0039913B51